MAADKRKYNILIIEDNQIDLVVIKKFLVAEIKFLTVSQAQNFAEAKNILSDKDLRFDVVLLDLTLPDNSGISLINDIIELSNNTPVIVLTAYTDFRFGVKSLSLGILDYLIKDGLTSLMLYKSIVYSIERNKIALECKESEKRYSNLFHLSPQPMWVYMIDTLRFEDVNEAAIKHYGYSREEFLSMTIKEIRPPEDFPLIEDTIFNDLSPEDYFVQHINRHKKKDGEIIHVEVHGNSMNYKGKKAKIIFARDITEKLNHVKALQEQNEKLREISWIQSHIVRAPVARIIGLLSLLKNLPDNNNEREIMMSYLEMSANELDQIIREISHKTVAREDFSMLHENYRILN